MEILDFNKMEQAADGYLSSGKYVLALAIYFYMTEGDDSLDGGNLAL